MSQVVLRANEEALEWIDVERVVALTAAATDATFYRDDLDDAQVAANRHVVAISGPTAVAAVANAHQHFVAAFVDGTFAGYVIATRHAEDDRELDWLMVHPDFHGCGVAGRLMEAGIDWLGRDRALWLNVIRFNERAIRFYRRFGFEIDPETETGKLVPNWVMRRPEGWNARASIEA
jgi:ribosomal protein S18 acetylase RimI-like enzyme